MRTAQAVLALFLAGTAIGGAADTTTNRKSSPTRSPVTEAMTGCLDQRGEAYYIAGPDLKAEAKLKGKSFSDDNFAQYIGHLVTVTGSVDRSSGDKPVVSVVKIENVKDSCR